MSRFWRSAFRVQYRVLAWLDPPIKAFWRRFGLGNVVELRVERRDGRGQRSRLLGVLRAGGGEYIGHPNGHVGWTRDLVAAGRAKMVLPGGRAEREVSAELLPVGDDEREQAILSTGQHPFPGNLVYRLGRRHIRVVGAFFRLRDVAAAEDA
jgi:hypothetical protein